MPYWYKDNKQYIKSAQKNEPTTKEIAERRHAARTPEQVAAIKARWAERRKRIKLMQSTANNVLKVAKDYGEVDYSVLEALVASGNLDKMYAEAKTLAKEVLKVKKQEAALSDLIPDVHKWHKQVSMSELQTVHTAVKGKLAQLSSLSLEGQAKKLAFEAYDYLGGNMNNVQGKYPNTWKVSQAAYVKSLNSVQYEIDVQTAKSELATMLAYSKAHPKAKVFAGLVADADAAIAKGADIAIIKNKMTIADIAYQKRLAAEAKRAKKSLTHQTAQMGTLTDKEVEKLLADFKVNTVAEMDSTLRNATEAVWATLSEEERFVLTKYTQTYSYLNEPLRGLVYSGSRPRSEYINDLPILTQALGKFRTQRNMVVRRGTDDFPIPQLGKNLSRVEAGDRFVDGAFLSTAAHRTKGFFKSIDMVIVVPKGAQGAFAEPFSHFTDSGKFNFMHNELWNGKTKETIMREFEWIGQRGCEFEVIRREESRIFLKLIGQLKNGL